MAEDAVERGGRRRSNGEPHFSIARAAVVIGLVGSLTTAVYFAEDRYFRRAEAADHKDYLEAKIAQQRQQTVAGLNRQAIIQEIGQLETMVKLYNLELDLLVGSARLTVREQRRMNYLETSIAAAEARLLELRGKNAGGD